MPKDDLARLRLARQHIHTQHFEQPEDVVRWMGAMQAQDYGQAVWAIGLRTRAGTLAGIEQALADRKIIRTWPMRGTIHFVLPQDAKWMLKLSAEKMLKADGRRQAQLGLDEAILERCKLLFHDALSGDRQLSRPEMLEVLEAAGISTESQRGYHILWYAAQSGLICIGPMKGKQQTFALLDEWAPNAREFSREEGIAELARRYFAGHAPATLRDFAWWAGLSLGDARTALAAVRSELETIIVDDVEYWMSPDGKFPPAEDMESVHLLPGFDELLLGYTNREAVLPGEHADKVVPGGNGVFRPFLVVENQVAGVWKRVVKKNAVEITLSPFMPLNVPAVILHEAAQNYSRFLGLPAVSLKIESVE